MWADVLIAQKPHAESVKVFLWKTATERDIQTILECVKGASREMWLRTADGMLNYGRFLSKHNQTVQERLCTETKEQPLEALRFPIESEEGISQRRSSSANLNTEIKKEPVNSIDSKKSQCTRCGLELRQNHLSVCKAKSENSRNCGIIWHFMRMCQRPKTANFRGADRSSNRGGMRRINIIGQATDQSDGCSQLYADNVVLALNLNGVGAPSFIQSNVQKGRLRRLQ